MHVFNSDRSAIRVTKTFDNVADFHVGVAIAVDFGFHLGNVEDEFHVFWGEVGFGGEDFVGDGVVWEG